MSLTDYLPGRREQRRHRIHDALRREKRANNELIEGIEAATKKILRLTAAYDQMNGERNSLAEQLDTAQIDLGQSREALRQAEETIRLRDQQIADLERRVEIGVKAEHVVTQTQEIPVITPVVALHESPLAVADPARIPPTWARDDDTRPIPAA